MISSRFRTISGSSIGRRQKRCTRKSGGVLTYLSCCGWLTFLTFSDTLWSSMRNLVLVPIILFNLMGQLADAQSINPQSLMPRRRAAVPKPLPPRSAQQTEVRRLFKSIEQNIIGSSLSLASVPFAEQVFVNTSTGESGYFSANQTVTILQRYLSARSLLSFEFSRLSDGGSTPFATGRLTFISGGRRESAQIYVSLRYKDSRWVVSQFNIY